MTDGKVLVVGATGKVGRHVVAGLLAEGVEVRAMTTRDPAEVALPDGAEVIRGDVTAPDSLPLDGVGSVFLVWPLLSAELAPPVVDAIAKRAGRIVYLSATSAGDDEVFHTRVERLIEASEADWTFLRAGGFASNVLGWADEIRSAGVVRDAYGAAARPLIHEKDIADVAVRVLVEEGHNGGEVRPDRPGGVDPERATANDRRSHRQTAALGGGLPRRRPAPTAGQRLAGLVRRRGPRLLGADLPRPGAGVPARGAGDRPPGADIPGMGRRPRRRLPLSLFVLAGAGGGMRAVVMATEMVWPREWWWSSEQPSPLTR
ncbi:NAD(P)H-binding protein [Saccharopolyspora shandongensis]|uniref:SDR family oxidoreductase n=1 Tax=Saccharopolyspora shandongensis TaxID=418495 RepID=UPI003440029A